MSAHFFERHDQFLKTSEVGAWASRLRGRYDAIIAPHRSILSGARVLDLGSHDGRWVMAALDAGASHVTGIEARPELVDRARQNLAYYGVPPIRYDFVVGDLNHRRAIASRFDVVFCLGYFYHTLNHAALWELMASTDAQYLILDGTVEPSAEPVIRLMQEDVSSHANGIAQTSIANGRILVGHPSPAALAMLCRQVGYTLDLLDWLPILSAIRPIPDARQRLPSSDDPLADYAFGSRVTGLAARMGHSD